MAGEQIIISVDIDAAKAAEGLSRTIQRVSELKQAQRELTQVIKEGNDVDGQKAAELVRVQGELARAQNAQKQYTAAVQAATKSAQPYGDSLNEMRRKLSDMTKAYDSMAKAQREGTSGKELLQAIQEQTAAISELERESGRWQRNVGNYPSAVSAVVPYFNQFKSALATLGLSFADLSKGGTAAFAALSTAARSFAVALLTPPMGVIVAILAAVAALVKAFTEGFKQIGAAIQRNDDLSTRLSATWARFTPVVTALRKVFESLANVVVNVVEGFGKLVEWSIQMANKVGLVSESFMRQSDGAAALVNAIDRLEEVERQHTINAARREREIAELRTKAVDRDAYNAKQREEYLQRAIDLERANLDEERKIANARYLIVVAQNKQRNDTSDEAKNKEVQALAEVERAEQAYSDGVRRITSQLVAARKEQTAAAQAAANKAAQAAKDARDKEEQAAAERERERAAKEAQEAKEAEEHAALLLLIRRNYEEAMVDSIVDGTERAMAAERLRAQREREELEARKAALREDDIQARDELSAIIAQKAEESNVKLFEINKKADDEATAHQHEVEVARQAQAQAAVNAIMDSGRALADFMSEVAKKNKALAVASKAVALGQIAVDTGRAIASGVASANAVPFPGNLAAIATTIATVFANMLTATKTVKGAKFAQGGIVGGTSFVGDRVIISVNSGEMILPRHEQQQLWQFVKGGSAGVNYETQAAAIAAAVAALPAPVLEYSEFQRFQSRVVNVKELTRL